MEQSRVKR